MQRSVLVSVAEASERPLLEGLLQFYFYDFSEMEPEGSTAMAFDAEGRFGRYHHLPDYWGEDGRVPLVIRMGEEAAGFALLNRYSHLGGAPDRNMAEFWVARKHRRRGVARAAVRQILAAYPGRWEVAVVERNAAAKVFWPRVIAEAPNVSQIVRNECDNESWRGPIWTFVAG